MGSDRRPGVLTTSRRRGRRGVAYLWFLIVALPLMAFGSVLAVDITRLIVSAREATNVAEAAAVAGAQQFSPNSWELDSTLARRRAEATVDFSARPDISALRSDVTRRVAVVSRPNSSYAGQRVTVTIDYQVPGMVFMPLLSLFAGNDDHDSVRNLTVTRSADVCIPGRYGPTDGYCVRPTP